MPEAAGGLTPREALERLREGNKRYVQDLLTQPASADRKARAALVAGQNPIAVILSCSDSRVPSELVFDQGLGDLFVVRVAGNVVAPSLVGSVEFAAAYFKTRLVVVMGHEKCGAVTSTLSAVRSLEPALTENIRDIVDRCRPAVESVVRAGKGLSDEELLDQAIRANVRHSCDSLRHGSRLLERLYRDEGLLVVGALYDLETGMVDFFDGV